MGNFEPARNIDDALDALDQSPLKPGDSRYIDCSRIRGDVQKHIIRMFQRYAKAGWDFHLLFTGYRGNGKTTELYQLQNKLKPGYEVFYFDAAKELDMNNLVLSDLLLAIAEKTVEGMNRSGYHLPEKLLEDVGDWFFEKILEKSANIAAEIGAKADIGIPGWVSAITAQIFTSVKTGSEIRETMRHKLDRNLTELIEKVNALLTAAREEVKTTHKHDLLFIIDSLDRLRVGLDRQLFLIDGDRLKQLKGNFIYVVPISLLYDEQINLSPFAETKVILPMISIYRRGIERREHGYHIAHLRDLLKKRIMIDRLFTHTDETINDLILASGGHLRDLIKLANYACFESDDTVTPEHVSVAINRLILDYERAIRDDEYEHLVNTYLSQTTSNDETINKLIYTNSILVYQESNAEEWKDVHPAVVMNEKFQRVLRLRER